MKCYGTKFFLMLCPIFVIASSCLKAVEQANSIFNELQASLNGHFDNTSKVIEKFKQQVQGQKVSFSLNSLVSSAGDSLQGLAEKVFNNITLEIPEIEFLDGGGVKITARAQVYSFAGKATLFLYKNKEFISAITPDEDFDLSKLSSVFDNEIVKGIKFTAALVVTNKKEQAKFDDYEIKPISEGFNIIGSITLTGKVADVVNGTQTVTGQAFISQQSDLLGSYVKAGMQSKIKLGSRVRTTIPNLTLEVAKSITGAPMPKVGFEFGLEIDMPDLPSPLEFQAGMALSVEDAEITGSMKSAGVVPQLFKIMGAPKRFGFVQDIDLQEVKMSMGVSYKTLAAGLPVDKCACSAKAVIAQRTIDFVIALDLGKGQGGAIGNFMGGVTLLNIVELFTQVTDISIPADKVPDVSIDEAHIYFMPQKMSVLGKVYTQGVKASGKGSLLKKKIELDASMLPDEIEGRVSIEAFNIGNVLLVSGSGGKDSLTGELKINKGLQKLAFSGKGAFVIPGIQEFSTDVRVQIAPTMVDIYAKQAVFGLADGVIEVKVKKDNIMDGIFNIEFSQSALAKFNDLTKQGALAIEESSRRDLDIASAQLKKVTDDLQNKKQKLGEMDQKVKAFRDADKKCREGIMKVFGG